MLVMRRRAGESFLIGEGIEVQILGVSGTRVKLGINAPASVPIVRREVQLTQDANQTAARSVSKMAIDSLLSALPALAAPATAAAEARQDFDELNNLSLLPVINT